MPVNISGSGSITGLSVGGLENGIITPSELSTGGPSWDATGNVQVNAINSGPLAGMRNAIVNGSFDVWQRGASFTGNEIGADRWKSNRTGTACTMSRQLFTLGQTDVPGEPTYFCRMVVTSVAGAGNYSVLLQTIEGVRTFAGQTITLSFWAKADATRNIAIDFSQAFGTGGSPSSVVTGIGAVKKTLTTSWQKISHTVSLPSISGKTLGTDGNDYLLPAIWFDAGSSLNSRTDTLGQQSGTFDIAQVQLEAGPVATPFERRPVGVELALCQRYYEVFTSPTAAASFGFVGQAISTSAAVIPFKFVVTKRAIPSFAQTGTWIVSTSTGASAGGTLILNSANLHTARLAMASATGLTGGNATLLSASTTDAELRFDAEL